MRVGTSYRQVDDLAESWDAIVIGSGIGGLATAAVLSRNAGKRVLVLERHYTAGGFTHAFHRPGFEWDVGVHYIGGVSNPKATLRRLFDYLTDGALEWEDMGEVYDRIVIDGRGYDFVKGKTAFRERMQSYFPEEKDAIERYLERIVETAKNAGSFYAEKAVPKPISTLFGGFMRRRALPDVRKTTREALEELTTNQELIGVLTGQWGDYGLPPAESSFFMHALLATHYLAGAGYPVGGATRIAATVVPGIEANGGAVITNAEVHEILVEGGKAAGVRLSDGRVLRAPMVISNAGVPNTFGKLLPESLRSARPPADQLDKVGRSVAHLSLYVGLEGTTEQLGLEKTNLWVYPTPHHEQNIERYLADPSGPIPLAFLSFPSAKDPDFDRRYPGHSTIEVVTLADYEWFRPWEDQRWKRRGAEYDELKASFEQRLLDVLYQHCPQTRGKVAHSELSTPLSTRTFAHHARGEIYGLAHSPARFEQRWLQPRTPLRGLYLTGSDICSAGVAGALMGGMLCSSAILGRNVMSTLLKPGAQGRAVSDTARLDPVSAE